MASFKKKEPCTISLRFWTTKTLPLRRAFAYGSQVSYKYWVSQPFVKPFPVERKQRIEKAVWQASEQRMSLGYRSPGNRLYAVTIGQYANRTENEYCKSNFASVILPLEIHHCRLHWLKAVAKLLLTSSCRRQVFAKFVGETYVSWRCGLLANIPSTPLGTHHSSSQPNLPLITAEMVSQGSLFPTSLLNFVRTWPWCVMWLD